MTLADRWMLPEGIEEILPEQAYKLEALRRQLLDLYESWGYELVVTPLVEYLDSLLVGSSRELDLHTFKVTDQLTGRMMGIRADITPQVARIDAHGLKREGPVRLCYADSVLHTKPRGVLTSRAPIRVGAELFGHAGIECDIELICLMHDMLKSVDIPDIHLVLGHVGLFRNLVCVADLSAESEIALFDALQRKAYDDIDQLLVDLISDENLRNLIQQLSRLSGGETVLEQAETLFADAPDGVKQELAELRAITAGVKKRLPQVTLCFDLSELRGYEYHTGIVFAAYTPAYGRAIAKGGRYDDIGEVFGRARPASGFDTDLKSLARLTNNSYSRRQGILAPLVDDAVLQEVIEGLRLQGEIVISSLTVDSTDVGQECACDRYLKKTNQGWQVLDINPE